jgi:hypothetical protein
MVIPHPQGFWAIPAVLAIVAMHWRPGRVPTRRVAGLFLWADAASGVGESIPPKRRILISVLNFAAACLIVAASCGLFSWDDGASGFSTMLHWLMPVLVFGAIGATLALSWQAGP